MAKKAEKHDKSKLPSGWFMAGASPEDYNTGLDTSIFHSGTRSAFLENIDKPKGFGTLMQQFMMDGYLGKRLKMSMWVKNKNLAEWAAPWMRVDGAKKGDMLSFDNMCKRPLKGSTDWTQYDIVLEVPKEATNIAFGVLMQGQGKLWIDDITFEIVDKKVETTDCPCSKRTRSSQPKNLNFEHD